MRNMQRPGAMLDPQREPRWEQAIRHCGQAGGALFTLQRLPVEFGRVQEGILVGALIGNVQWIAQESAF